MDYSILTNSLTQNINSTTVLTIMGTVVTATIGIFLAVWGGRKIINGIQGAISNGNIPIGFDNLDRKNTKLLNKMQYYEDIGRYDRASKIFNRLPSSLQNEINMN